MFFLRSSFSTLLRWVVLANMLGPFSPASLLPLSFSASTFFSSLSFLLSLTDFYKNISIPIESLLTFLY